MKTFLDKIREGLSGLRERSRYRAFVDLVMAGAALVARADGDERLSELVARDQVLERLTDLQWFDIAHAVEAYEKHSRLLIKNADGGRRQILEKIAQFDGDRNDRLALVRACLAIGQADSDFSAPERSVVEQICHQLGVDPGELGVYDI
jgi:tellurite resistance protein